MINIEFSYNDLDKCIEKKVKEGHFEYEKSHGIYDEYKKFHITAKLDEIAIGVLSGYTVFGEIYVDDLWTDKNYRKKGYGRKLLLYLENKYNMHIITNGFKEVQKKKLEKSTIAKYFKTITYTNCGWWRS